MAWLRRILARNLADLVRRYHLAESRRLFLMVKYRRPAAATG
jgi:hypothetical protein